MQSINTSPPNTSSTGGPRRRAVGSNRLRLRRGDGDAWVDRVTDQVQALLSEHGLEMELCVWSDPVAEHMHAVGFDGSAARYFRSLECDRVASDSPAPRGNPMVENIQNPMAGGPLERPT